MGDFGHMERAKKSEKLLTVMSRDKGGMGVQSPPDALNTLSKVYNYK